MGESSEGYSPQYEIVALKDEVKGEVTTALLPYLIDAQNRDNSRRLCPEAEYAGLQEGLLELKTDKPEQVQAFVDRYKNSELGKKIEEIRATEFSDDQVEAIRAVNEALKDKDNQFLMKGIRSALTDFYNKRLHVLGATDEKMIEASNAHIAQVVELSQSVANNDPDPLTAVFAYIHDISKVEGTKVHLGLHEAGSASLAKNIIRSTFDTPVVRNNLMKSLQITDRAEYDQYIEQVGRCAEVAVASHGKNEFPDKMARFAPIDKQLGLSKLFGSQLYVDAYVSPEKYAANCSTENKVFLNRLIGGVCEADMVLGILKESMVKYHAMSSVDDFYNARKGTELIPRQSSLDYQMSLAITYYEYMRDMPNDLGIVESRATEIQQTALIFALAAKTEGLDTQDPTVENINAQFATKLGAEKYNNLLHISGIMRQAFADGQRSKDEYQRKELYQAHKAAFGLLSMRIGEYFTDPIDDPEFDTEYQTFIKDTLPALKASFNK